MPRPLNLPNARVAAWTRGTGDVEECPTTMRVSVHHAIVRHPRTQIPGHSLEVGDLLHDGTTWVSLGEASAAWVERMLDDVG